MPASPTRPTCSACRCRIATPASVRPKRTNSSGTPAISTPPTAPGCGGSISGSDHPRRIDALELGRRTGRALQPQHEPVSIDVRAEGEIRFRGVIARRIEEFARCGRIAQQSGHAVQPGIAALEQIEETTGIKVVLRATL